MAVHEEQRVLQEQQQIEFPRQRQLLGEVHSEFKGEKFDSSYAQVAAYAVDPAGGRLRQDEWLQLADHRYISLVEKARRYDATARAAPTLPRKLARVPKTLRPGSSQERPGTAVAEEYQASLAHQRSAGGDVESTKAVFLAREQLKQAVRRGRAGR